MNKKGFILIYILGISLAFASLLLFLNFRTEKYLESFKKKYDEIEIERIFDIGFEVAKKILENDKNNFDWIGENWAKERIFKIGNYQIRIVITDENSKINLNKILEEKGKTNETLLEIFKNLIVVLGYPFSLVDCFLDWIDEDNLPRPFGAESSYYHSIGFKFAPPNRNLLSLRELSFIKGFEKDILEGTEEKKGILNFITIYSDDKININTCKGEIINAMGFTKNQVDRILAERDYRPLNERFLIEINREAFLKYRNLIKYKSNYFKVSIFLKKNGEDEREKEGIFKKDKNIELIRKGIL
ncbi:MAG: general secretion pathway protein GspK [Candidatus Omnitrophica bacterium]|nr:general secretion pathway protein GspK [Candidatus Omnitrophota bacterium]MCM8807366.1 general secretion pathway protein GspK [Candidatus Omnitrophota bacterium]